MTRRYMYRPATKAENITVITLTVTLAGMLCDLILANDLLIGGAIGCAVGFAIGWHFRHAGTKPNTNARRSNTE